MGASCCVSQTTYKYVVRSTSASCYAVGQSCSFTGQARAVYSSSSSTTALSKSAQSSLHLVPFLQMRTRVVARTCHQSAAAATQQGNHSHRARERITHWSKIAYASHTNFLHLSTLALSEPNAWEQQYWQRLQPRGFTLQLLVLKPGWEGRVLVSVIVFDFSHVGAPLPEYMHSLREAGLESIQHAGTFLSATRHLGAPPATGHVIEAEEPSRTSPSKRRPPSLAERAKGVFIPMQRGIRNPETEQLGEYSKVSTVVTLPGSWERMVGSSSPRHCGRTVAHKGQSVPERSGRASPAAR